MQRYQWFERHFTFGLSEKMLPFYLDRLEGTCYRLEAKVRDIPDSILSKKLNDKWSVKQTIGHLAEVDEISLRRIDEIINGTSPLTSAVFDTKQDYNCQSINQVLHYFVTTRMKTIKRYKSLDDEEKRRSSMHPRLKVKMTPVDLAWFDAEHDDHHLVRITEIISTLTPQK